MHLLNTNAGVRETLAVLSAARSAQPKDPGAARTLHYPPHLSNHEPLVPYTAKVPAIASPTLEGC